MTSLPIEIRAVIAARTGLAPDRLADDLLIEDLGLDSLGMAELLLAVEERLERGLNTAVLRGRFSREMRLGELVSLIEEAIAPC